MTCRHTRALLEDFVDAELDEASADALKTHLLECEECRAQVETSAVLKSLLKHISRPDPGPVYWSEAERLVLAKTVEAADEPVYERVPAGSYIPQERSSVFRSAVSVCVSLAVLFGAFWLGSQRQGQELIVISESQSLYVSASLQPMFSETEPIYTQEDQDRLTRGLALLVAPGGPGRFEAIPGMFGMK